MMIGSGCGTTHISPARFVSRSRAGGVVATPRAEVGMDDANAMIAAHCGVGGFAITREGESLIGDTVVTEGAASMDSQTTEGSGQVQGHENSKTVYARGSDWQVHYTCNDSNTVNMGLITRSRTEPSRLAWGADVGAGMMFLYGHEMDAIPNYGAPRHGSPMALGANGWLGYKLSDKFSMGGGLGINQVVGMPQWHYNGDEIESDARAIELFATAKYTLAPRVDMKVRVGLSAWDNVDVDGGPPFAAFQLGYKVSDVGPDSGVYIGAGVSSNFSSDLTRNATPTLSIGFH
jgi:hypothetical protein